MQTTKKNNKKKPSKNKKEVSRLTPKGIFDLCMMDIFNLQLDDRRIALAWELFDSRMRKNGYVSEE